jgi:hypothetical protein
MNKTIKGKVLRFMLVVAVLATIFVIPNSSIYADNGDDGGAS